LRKSKPHFAKIKNVWDTFLILVKLVPNIDLSSNKLLRNSTIFLLKKLED